MSNDGNIIRQRPYLQYIRKDGADKEFHSHLHPEFIFVESGSGRFETKENQYPIKSGDLIICSKNTQHCEYMFQDSSIFHLGFSKTILSGMEENEIIREPFCIIHTDAQYDCIKTYFCALMDEYSNEHICDKIMKDDLLRVLLVSVLRLAVTDIDIAFAKDKTFFEAKDYIDRNFTIISSIDDMCKLLGINKFYLIHLFNVRLKMPPIKYVVSKRMEKAMGLLSSTNEPISTIAEKCGYNDIAYFCRVFKRTAQISPLQYRTKNKATAK